MKYTTQNGWTKQAMLDRVQACLPEKGKCLSQNGRWCTYRNDLGENCAAGAFIPEVYAVALEYEFNVAQLMVNFPAFFEMFPLSLEGMFELQRAHDRSPTRISGRTNAIAWIKNNVEDAND